ncbi:MAG: EVE domain-containing protein [Candidatus Paceibacterota bacterium]
MNYWLLKSEPSSYSIDNLQSDKKTEWSGVRNYQARNFMKKMEVGDLVLFYHSNTAPIGVVGSAKVVSCAHPDSTAFDTNDSHYDPKSTKEKPIWECVDIAFVEKCKRVISLEEIKNDTKLSGMVVAQKGSRLSVQPVSKKHFERIVSLSKKKPA